jgi:hypothetical protein
MRRLTLAAGFLLLAGCAPSNPWMSPTQPKEMWDRDYTQCRRYADAEVGFVETERDSDSPFRDYDRKMARKRYDGYVNSCMRDLGYVRNMEKK